MKMAFLFPGQASQYVGMGKDWYETFPFSKEIYDKAADSLQFDVRSVSFSGPRETLRETKICQPAIFLHSLSVVEELRRRGVEPDFVAGHSLGEHVSLSAVGVLGVDDGLYLVRVRGEAVQEASEIHPGTMAAIIGLNEEHVEAICREVRGAGVLVAANYNAPGQVVVSGERSLVERVVELVRQQKGRAVHLEVSGAFHTSFMDPARQRVQQVLSELPVSDPAIPIIANVDAKPMTTVAQIRKNLVAQLTSPVRWRESMEYLVKAGVDTFIEVGPGKVLQGLLLRIRRQVKVYGVDTVADLEKIPIAELKSGK